jgi:hypothetical protein
MADIAELTRYMESNPDDHEERWHLVKKLYAAGEYDQALDHLLVLKSGWTPKVNLARYLGAAYYRLGRYDEAVAELQEGVTAWPEEVSIREQLARVLEAAGKKEAADKVWQDIWRIKPDHPMALQFEPVTPPPQKPAPPPRAKKQFPGADFGIEPSKVRVCPNCGAENSKEFDRCWKCHAMFFDVAAADSGLMPPVARRGASVQVSSVGLALGAGAVLLLLAIGAYLSLRQFLFLRLTAGSPTPILTVKGLFDTALLSTRGTVGLILIGAWPVSLWMALRMTKVRQVAFRALAVAGLLLAALAYDLSWGPVSFLGWSFLAVLAVSLAPVALFFGIGFGRSVLVWLIQGALVTCVAMASVAALEGGAAVREFPAVRQYARTHDTGPDAGRYPWPPLYVPVESAIRWESSGSTWLDAKSGNILFEITTANPADKLIIELKDDKKSVSYKHITESPFMFPCKIAPGKTYTLLITGQENTKVDLLVSGLLAPRLGS